MSWSTSLTVEATDEELPVLTDELAEQARERVRTNLDEFSEHDTFDGAIAAARALLAFGPGTRIVSLSGHKSGDYRSCNASTNVPTVSATVSAL